MAANINHRSREPSCPLVQGPYRHYILNFVWIFVNITCVILTFYHLTKLYQDFSNMGAEAVRVATLVISAVTTKKNISKYGKVILRNLLMAILFRTF